MNRRQFLAAAPTYALAASVSVPALMVTADPAMSFWGPAAFYLGSFVAGQIAAHNRRNVSLYYLDTIYKELGVLSGQIASVQTATAVVLTELAGLPDQWRTDLDVQSTKDLHRRINDAIMRYQNACRVVDKYSSRDDWLGAPHVQEDLHAILADLWAARTELQVSEFPHDPSAALVLSCAALAEMGLLNALRYDRQQVQQRISEYEEYFARILNEKLFGSAASYLVLAAQWRKAAEERMRRDPIGSDIAVKGKATICAGLTDYRPATHRLVKGAVHHNVADGIMINIEPKYNDHPSRSGKLTRIWSRVSYHDVAAEEDRELRKRLDEVGEAANLAVSDGATGTTLRRIRVSEPDIESKEPGPGNWQSAPDCPMETSDLPETDPAALIRDLEGFRHWKDGIAAVSGLQKLVDEYNIQTARQVFARRCIESVKSTQATMAAIKESYR